MSKTKKVTEIKTLFMGTGNFAGTILNALLEEEYNIIGVFTKSDKTIHKNKGPKENEAKGLAEKYHLPLHQPEKLDADIISQIKKASPDLIVIVAYGKIIPREIIDVPQFGCINVHPSMLSKFRGPSPIQNALLAGEKETGTTIMLINEKMDTGDILIQKQFAIDPNDTYPILSQKLALLSAKLLSETLPLWIEGKIKPTAQDDSRATLCQLIDREDGHIVWNEEAEKIYNRYRALSPWPGIFSFWKNRQNLSRLKLNKIALEKNTTENIHIPGEVFDLNGRIAIQASKGAIILEEVQLEGKKAVDIRSFINGYPKFIGSILQ